MPLPQSRFSHARSCYPKYQITVAILLSTLRMITADANAFLAPQAVSTVDRSRFSASPNHVS